MVVIYQLSITYTISLNNVVAAYELAKVGVEGSNPFARSSLSYHPAVTYVYARFGSIHSFLLAGTTLVAILSLVKVLNRSANRSIAAC